MGMLVTDVAVRRIHWDWTIKRSVFLMSPWFKPSTTRKINAAPRWRGSDEKQTLPLKRAR
jgi:hypothetical protein